MPYSADHKAETRQRIVSSAAHLLRAEGVPGTGVARVMKHAGLTHGGFYAHFKSKDDLIAAAFEEAVMDAGRNLTEGLDGMDAQEKLAHYIGRYLSRAHRDNPEHGCPLSSLGAELSRGGTSARQGFERGLLRLMKGLDQILPEQLTGEVEPDISENDDLISIMAMMVGGLVLSRAVADEEFSDRILRTTRRSALKMSDEANLTGETS